MLLSEHCNAVFGLPCLNKGNDVDDNDDLDLENEQVSSLRDSSGSPPKSIPSSQFSSCTTRAKVATELILQLGNSSLKIKEAGVKHLKQTRGSHCTLPRISLELKPLSKHLVTSASDHKITIVVGSSGAGRWASECFSRWLELHSGQI